MLKTHKLNCFTCNTPFEGTLLQYHCVECQAKHDKENLKKAKNHYRCLSENARKEFQDWAKLKSDTLSSKED